MGFYSLKIKSTSTSNIKWRKKKSSIVETNALMCNNAAYLKGKLLNIGYVSHYTTYECNVC